MYSEGGAVAAQMMAGYLASCSVGSAIGTRIAAGVVTDLVEEPRYLRVDAGSAEFSGKSGLPRTGLVELGIKEPVEIRRQLHAFFIKGYDVLPANRPDEETQFEYDILP